jgi:hypothetical protein
MKSNNINQLPYEIKSLIRMYQDSNYEIREYILGEIKRIETETSCGLLLVTSNS